MKRFIIISAAVLIAASAIPFATGFRLPRNIIPWQYDIQLTPNIDSNEFTFEGYARIKLDVREPTRTLIIHKSRNIEIHRDYTDVSKEWGKMNRIRSTYSDEDAEFYRITFEEDLDLGNHTMTIKWNGRSPSSFDGFSRMPYQLDNGETKNFFILMTYPTGARKIFPCWDEPEFKAQFILSITHPPSYIALSNMPVAGVRKLTTKHVTYFETSPKMSTHAFTAFVVEDYDSIKSDGGNITFYALPKYLDSVTVPLHISEDLEKLMEFHTGIPYAIPKLDHIIIPEGLYKDTLKNWGLLSYRHELIELRNTTLIPNIEAFDDISFKVARQIACQWFGNLVTPDWWDDVWLTESFSLYYAYKLLEKADSLHSIMDRFVIKDIVEIGFNPKLSDKLVSIKQMPANEMRFEFAISPMLQYRGAGVLHMLDHILGKDTFRAGIRRYMKEHQFRNANTADLWQAFQEAYDEKYGSEKPLNIRDTLDPWIKQSGVPVINVTRNYESGETIIVQGNIQSADLDNRWRIPINYATKSNPSFSKTTPIMWMERDEDIKTIPDIDVDDWIIVNIQQRGFYQVNYDKKNWQRLTEYLNKDHKKIHPLNRAQLIEDAHRMYKNDNSYIDILFDILHYLHNEIDYLPWIPASKVISDLHTKVRNTDVEIMFSHFVLFITNHITDNLGFNNNTIDTMASIRARNLIAPIICKYGHAECRSFAKRQFDLYLENPTENAFPLSNWDWILCYGLSEANDVVWNKLLHGQLPLPESVNKRRFKLVRCTKRKEKRDQYIAETMNADVDATPYQFSDVFTAFLESDEDDVNYIMQYAMDHFNDIETFLRKDEYHSEIIYIYGSIIFAIRNQEQYNKMNAFLESHNDELKVKLRSSFSELELIWERSQSYIERSKRITTKIREILKYFT